MGHLVAMWQHRPVGGVFGEGGHGQLDGKRGPVNPGAQVELEGHLKWVECLWCFKQSSKVYKVLENLPPKWLKMCQSSSRFS